MSEPKPKGTDVPFGMPADEELEQYDPPQQRRVAGNELYRDLRCAEWSEAREALEQDCELAVRLRAADDVTEELLRYIGERTGTDDENARLDAYWASIYSYLDPGIASTVLALSAAGAAPVGSCNGGVFGDQHFEQFPLVCFYACEETGRQIARVAREAGLILEFNRITRTPVLSCLDIEPFIRFAKLMIAEFGADSRTDQ